MQKIVKVREPNLKERVWILLVYIIAFPLAILVFIGATALSWCISLVDNFVSMLSLPSDIATAFKEKLGLIKMQKRPWPNNILDN